MSFGHRVFGFMQFKPEPFLPYIPFLHNLFISISLFSELTTILALNKLDILFKKIPVGILS